MDDTSGFIPGLLAGILLTATVMGWIFVPKDILFHEKFPYCETTSVSGKDFTRCLKAIEIPVPEKRL